MRKLAAFWILALATFGVMDVGLAGDARIEPILVNSENSLNKDWPEIMYFPDAEGEPKPGKILGEGYYVPAKRDDVTFKLYTRRGPKEGEDLSIGDVDQLRRSTFNHSQRSFIITHGFLSGIQSRTIQDIKDMYLGYKEGNVVAVDWSRIASNWLYFIVKRQTKPVGKFVAQFVIFLVAQGGVDLSDGVHLVGHSLGAHVMGIAGKEVFRNLGSKVHRITGLDPAGPLFSLEDRNNRLDSSDGDFVDVIHTCGGWLGIGAAIGHVDFFPNGGCQPQPGCHFPSEMAGVCSHSRSWEFFAESINSLNFTSLPCESYQDYPDRGCNRGLEAPMGDSAPTSIEGNYFLNTAPSPPYGLGPDILEQIGV